MAKEVEYHAIHPRQLIALTRQEATDLIGLLTAQLANVPLVNNMAGACPDVTIYDEGSIKKVLSFVIDDVEDQYND